MPKSTSLPFEKGPPRDARERLRRELTKSANGYEFRRTILRLRKGLRTFRYPDQRRAVDTAALHVVVDRVLSAPADPLLVGVAVCYRWFHRGRPDLSAKVLADIATATPPKVQALWWTNELGRWTPFHEWVEASVRPYRIYLDVTEASRDDIHDAWELVKEAREQLGVKLNLGRPAETHQPPTLYLFAVADLLESKSHEPDLRRRAEEMADYLYEEKFVKQWNKLNVDIQRFWLESPTRAGHVRDILVILQTWRAERDEVPFPRFDVRPARFPRPS